MRDKNCAADFRVLHSASLRENQEFETDAPPGYRSTAAFGGYGGRRATKYRPQREIEWGLPLTLDKILLCCLINNFT